MHKHVRSNYQNPSQKFLQKHKNIKSPPPKKKKTWKPRSTCMKYMKKEKKERSRALTKWRRLGLGRKWKGKKDFREKKGLGSKKEREREIQIFEVVQNWVRPQKYLYKT